jgi:hypothetical protein
MTESVQKKTRDASLRRYLASADVATELWASCAPHQRALLGLLAVADRQDVDVASLIASLGEELPRANRIQMVSFANRLADTSDPIQALPDTSGLLPSNVILGLKLAREEGTLSDLYAQFDERSKSNHSGATGPPETSYSRASSCWEKRSYL